MNAKHLAAVSLLSLATAAMAAPPVFTTVDRSSPAVMDAATAKAVWQETLSDANFTKRLAKLKAPSKWAFLSQVEGGFTESKTCVVTARAALVPRAGKNVVFAPDKMATAFDAQPNATQDQCKALAKAKLGEAVKAVASSLIAE